MPDGAASAANQSIPLSNEKIDCANLVGVDRLEAYAELIESILTTSSATSPTDSRLFAASFTMLEGGKVAHVTREQLGDYQGSIPTLHDWRIIEAAFAARNVHSGGWRGCFLDHGKAFFEADGAGNIGLTSFDFDRKWEPK